jgi:hypothetical protein
MSTRATCALPSRKCVCPTSNDDCVGNCIAASDRFGLVVSAYLPRYLNVTFLWKRSLEGEVDLLHASRAQAPPRRPSSGAKIMVAPRVGGPDSPHNPFEPGLHVLSFRYLGSLTLNEAKIAAPLALLATSDILDVVLSLLILTQKVTNDQLNVGALAGHFQAFAGLGGRVQRFNPGGFVQFTHPADALHVVIAVLFMRVRLVPSTVLALCAARPGLTTHSLFRSCTQVHLEQGKKAEGFRFRRGTCRDPEVRPSD